MTEPFDTPTLTRPHQVRTMPTLDEIRDSPMTAALLGYDIQSPYFVTRPPPTPIGRAWPAVTYWPPPHPDPDAASLLYALVAYVHVERNAPGCARVAVTIDIPHALLRQCHAWASEDERLRGSAGGNAPSRLLRRVLGHIRVWPSLVTEHSLVVTALLSRQLFEELCAWDPDGDPDLEDATDGLEHDARELPDGEWTGINTRPYHGAS